MNLPENFTTPGNKWLSASEVANNLNIISDLITITVKGSDSNDPTIRYFLEDFKIQLLKKVNNA